MGGHLLVGEFFECAIKPFGHGRFGFPLGGSVVDAILVKQPFHALIVLFILICLQLHGPALCRFVFQQMAQRIAHGRAPLTLQAHHPGILAQNVDNGKQIAGATIVLEQFRVLHFHQISLPGMISGGVDTILLRGKH